MENIAEILEGVKTNGNRRTYPSGWVTALVPVWRYIYM